MTSNIPPNDPSVPPQRPEDYKKRSEPKFNIKKPSTADDLLSFAKENTRDTAAYILLIIGFLLLFFEPLYGGTLIGALVGIYYSAELLYVAKNAQRLIEEFGMVKSLVLGGALLSFFVSGVGPATIIVVTAVTVALKQLIVPDKEV
jgi:hypothetical protein